MTNKELIEILLKLPMKSRVFINGREGTIFNVEAIETGILHNPDDTETEKMIELNPTTEIRE